jgi:CO/xanthine dehydrogenase FAD-binding subunit
MMHLPRFKHLRPGSMMEAAQLLKRYGPRTKLVAGGTDLYPRMKYGLVLPEIVISLKALTVEPPSMTPNGDLQLDALMTLSDVARSPEIRGKIPLLAEAALSVGSNQVRNMGTLGGNLCQENRCFYFNQTHTFQFVDSCFKRDGDRCYLIPEGKKCWAIFPADTVPALISLGAQVNIIGSDSSHQVPIESLYTGDALKPLAIGETEIVDKIIIPAQTSPRGSAFMKFTLRGGMAFAGLNLAVVLDLEEDHVLCRGARITVGAVSPGPIRSINGEGALKDQCLSKDLFQEVSHMVANEIHPFPHHGYSASYLRECLRVQIFRALNLALERVSNQLEPWLK